MNSPPRIRNVLCLNRTSKDLFFIKKKTVFIRLGRVLYVTIHLWEVILNYSEMGGNPELLIVLNQSCYIEGKQF